MTNQAIAGTRHAWATLYCRSCKRIVSYQAHMVVTHVRSHQSSGVNWSHSEPVAVYMVECACGALIEL